ncbi:unnamed protein product [Rhizophagus irregularis]|nr:unnamed protein product [Rhizophagus irregularis]
MEVLQLGDVISDNNPTSWAENFNNESKIQNNEPISPGRAPYVRTMFEYFQQAPEIQSMTNANYDHSNILQDYNNYNNYQPIPILSSSPKSSLSHTIPSESKVNSGSITNSAKFGGKLQRRKTIFDNPYYSFSKVDNPDYASLNTPPPPKPNRQPPPIPAPSKPLPQVPGSNTNGQNMPIPSPSNNYPTPSLSGPDLGQMTMQLAPISDSSFSQLGSGIGSTGLKNLGNTCFMNSVIQCLSGTVPFARYFLDVLWSDSYTFVSPVTFKEAIGRFAPQFSGTEQQDSQEFLSFLLDGLHEDLNIIKEKPKILELTPQEEEEREYLPSQMVSEMEWEKYLMQEILDGDDAWNCPRCKCRRRATKQLTISRLPDVLLIHLKRFSFNGPFRDKLETMFSI